MAASTHEILTNLRRVAEAAPDDLLHMAKVVEKADCGTARCLLGWAIIDPWFRANTLIGTEIAENWSAGHMPSTSTPLNEIFCLEKYDCEYLFAYGEGSLETKDPHAVSKAEVLCNIDSLLVNGWAFQYDASRYLDFGEDEEED